MSGKSYILALDQGTTGSTALLIDEEGQVVSNAYREVLQFYPQSIPLFKSELPALSLNNVYYLSCR